MFSLEELQAILTFLTLLAVSLAAILAWNIGKKQNEINKKALDIQNFVEVFVMPDPRQVIIDSGQPSEQKIFYWTLLIKNASSYPIYLNNFTPDLVLIFPNFCWKTGVTSLD